MTQDATLNNHSKTIFIADLHLDKQYPDANSAFITYLADLKNQPIDALYILGDLFEYWLGDDCIDKTAELVADSLTDFASNGTPVYFIHGNRDFLLAETYAKRCKMTLLPEHEVIHLYGIKTLILHGDTLCTDDEAYMQFRAKVRTSAWQENILRLPAWVRRLKAKHLRYRSKKANKNKTADIMDVSQTTVEQLLRDYQVTQMIHGHTHRPAVHKFEIDHQPATRYVVGDWYHQGSALEVTKNGSQLVVFPLTHDTSS